VVDPGHPVGHDGEGPARAVGQQRGGHGVGEGAAARRLAQGGGGRQRLGPGPGVELARPQRVERPRHLAGPQGGVDPADGGEGLGGGGAELLRLLGGDRVHRVPPSSALATIMRWTSMVPDATVAACA
jgi:hypothetical protein